MASRRGVPADRLAGAVAQRVAAADLRGAAARYAVPGRLSGSEAVDTAMARVADDLRAIGLGVAETRVRVLTSRPGRAFVRLCSTIYPGQSAAFAAPETDRRGPALWSAASDPREWLGRVVVLTTLPSAQAVALAEAVGAQAVVAAVPEASGHIVSVSPVAGSPTPWTVGNLPSLPVALLSGDVARALLAQLGPAGEAAAPGPTLSVSAGVDTRWRDIPLLTADVGAAGGDDFVLAAAHADAWYEGGMDDAAGLAALVESARALAGDRGALRRSLRLAVWSGHEDGAGGGAQAYADQSWETLDRACAAYLRVAAPGGSENADLSGLEAMALVRPLVERATQAVTGAGVEPGPADGPHERAFAGIGVAAARLGGGRSADPEWPRGRAWHSPADTVEALDDGLLARDAAIAANAIADACASPQEPVDLALGARSLAAAVNAWQERLAGLLDLGLAAQRASQLVGACEALASEDLGRSSSRQAARNRAVRAAGRLIVRLAASGGGRFEASSALPLGALPTLAACESLIDVPPLSAPADLASVAARRARTAVEVSLREAVERVEAARALSARH